MSGCGCSAQGPVCAVGQVLFGEVCRRYETVVGPAFAGRPQGERNVLWQAYQETQRAYVWHYRYPVGEEVSGWR